MKKFILYLWQLPQNLIGEVILLWHKKFCRHEIKQYVSWGVHYYYLKHINDCGISLGSKIFLDSDKSIRKNDVMHEKGHQKQSLYLGPLYLLIIGLPSAIGNLLNRFIKFDYYKQPWEKWADKLGNVQR